MHAQADGRAAQRRDVAARVDGPRAEPGVGRIDELHLHPLDEGKRGGIDPEHRGAHAGRLHEVVERLHDAEQRALEPAAVGHRRHGRPLERCAGVRAREQIDLGGGEADQLRRHRHVRAARDCGRPRLHVDPIRAGRFDARDGHQHGKRALPQVRRPEREDDRGGRGDDAQHGQRPAQALALEAAPDVGLAAPLDRRLHQLLEQFGGLDPRAPRGGRASRHRPRSPAPPGTTVRAPPGRAPPAGR